MKLRLLLTSITLLVAGYTTQAQFSSGYYLSAGDTTKGFIKLFKNSDKATFKKTLDTKEVEELDPALIEEIGIGSAQKLVSFRLDGFNRSKPFYLKVIVEGTTDLYQAVIKNTEYFFLPDREGEIVLLDREKFRNQLSVYFYDCQKVHQQILSRKSVIDYRVGDLHDVVLDYNLCDDQDVGARSLLPKNNMFFKLGFELSYLNQNFSITENRFGGGMDYPNNSGIGFGVLGEIAIKNFALETGFQFHPRETSLPEVPLEVGVSFGTTDVNYQLNQLAIPVILRYYFPTGNVRPFLNAGIHTAISVNNSIETSSTEPTVTGDFGEPEFAILLGGGVKMGVGPKGEVSLGIQYIDARLPYGTLFTFDEAEGVIEVVTAEFADLMTEMIKVSIGYKYNLSKK